VPNPRFWILLWLATLAGLVIILVGAFWLQYSLRRMSRRNQELEDRMQSSVEALRQASLTDALTGLHNRRFLELYMALDLESTCRVFRDMLAAGQDTTASKEDILLYLMNLDRFNRVNLTWGRPAGDAVLAQLARAVTAGTRKTDFRIRWEGDTFLVVARHARRSEAPTVARKLAALVRGQSFQVPGGASVQERVSIGYAALPLHPNHPELGDWQAGLAMAAQCLQAAKLTGRDRWVGATLEPDADPAPFRVPDAWNLATALDQRLVRVRCSEPDFIWPSRQAFP
jgi:diguanylate cyclase (GGDEF)-like protein